MCMSRLSSPDSESRETTDAEIPCTSVSGLKRSAAEEPAEETPSTKRPAVTLEGNHPAAARVQAAFRGFRVRGDGVAALARSQSESRREQAQSARAAEVELWLGSLERPVSAVGPRFS